MTPGNRVVLRLRRADRVRKFQGVQHGLAALLLLTASLREIHERSSGHLALAIAEALAAAVVLGSLLVRGALERRGAHARVGWAEIFGAVMVFLEGYARHRYAKRFFLFHPEAVQAAALLASGIFEERLATGRYVEAGEMGLLIKRLPWRREHALWSEIVSFRSTPDAFVLDTGGKTLEIPLRRFSNAGEVSEWLEARLAEHGIGVGDTQRPLT